MSRRVDYASVLAHFESDTTKHEMTVLRDDGIDRHLRFKSPDTNACWFDVITWGGRLYIGGDNGAYVFARLTDMFQFFRGDLGDINPTYWAEKVQASEEGEGIREFDQQWFREAIHARRVELVRSLARRGALDKAARRELWDSLTSEVLDQIDSYDTIEIPVYLAQEWSFTKGSIWNDDYTRYSLNFDDFPSCKRPTSRFIWNCFAIVWAIDRYDAHKAAKVPA